MDGLVGAVAHGDIARLGLLLADDEHVGHTVDGAGLANLVADLLVAVIDLDAHLGSAEPVGDLLGVVAGLLGHGKHLDLERREPRRELACVLLGEHANEALERAEARTVNHDRLLLGAVCVRVLQLEVMRELEVELDRAALPGTAKAVLQVEIDLGTVECAVALVDGVLDAHGLERLAQALLGVGPVLVGAHGVLGARGELDAVREAKLRVVGRDEVRDVRDLLGDLVRADEEVRVVLRELADAEQAVQGALELVTVVKAGLGELERQIAIAARLVLVDEACAGTVHRLDRVVFLVDLRRVHVGLVVVPVARGLPQSAGEDDRRLDLLVAELGLHLVPVVHEGVADDHAVGQPEREARAGVVHHEELHLLADLAVVAACGLLKHLQVLLERLLGAEGDAVDAREHLVVLVALPVGARDTGKLEGLEGLGIGEVRAHAHVDVLALLVERDAGVLGQVADVLELVLLVALCHELLGVLARELEGLELQVLLADLLHLGLDRGEVVLADLLVAEVDVIEEAVVGGGAIGKVRLGVQALDGLRHDVGGGVADDVELLVSRALGHMAVVAENLHGWTSFLTLVGLRAWNRWMDVRAVVGGGAVCVVGRGTGVPARAERAACQGRRAETAEREATAVPSHGKGACQRPSARPRQTPR